MDFWKIQGVWILLGYCSGSIPFGLLWTRLFQKGDPRTMGSGNIGATNVYRLAGIQCAALVYISDFLKSAILVFCAPQSCKMMTGLACVIGHIFSIFLKLKGGKGVATACGVIAVLMPLYFLAGLMVWFLSWKTTGYVSLASLLGIVCVYLLHIIWGDLDYSHGLSSILLLIMYTHRSNIVRLFKGHEHKIKNKK